MRFLSGSFQTQSSLLDTLQAFVNKYDQQLQDSAAFEPYDFLADT
jgi:hypothetical protein